MSTQNSQLIENLNLIYNEKLAQKTVLETTSDDFLMYHTYIAALKPSGYTSILSNGQVDVSSYKYAYVSVDGGGIVPAGSYTITSNGEYDVYNYATAVVEVDSSIPEGYVLPSGNIDLIQNGMVDVKEYAYATVAMPVPTGTVNITENGTAIDVSQYASANVAVPIPSGYVLPSGILEINENVIAADCSSYQYVTVDIEGGGSGSSSTPTLDYPTFGDFLLDGTDPTNTYVYLGQSEIFGVDDSGDNNIYISEQYLSYDNYDELAEIYGDDEAEWPETAWDEYVEYTTLYNVYLTTEDEETMNNYVQLQEDYYDTVSGVLVRPLIYIDSMVEEELTQEEEEEGEYSYKYSVYGSIVPGMENVVNLSPTVEDANGYIQVASSQAAIIHSEVVNGTINIEQNGNMIDVHSYYYANVNVPGYTLVPLPKKYQFGVLEQIEASTIYYIDNYDKTCNYYPSVVSIPVLNTNINNDSPKDYTEYLTYINDSPIVESGSNKFTTLGNNIFETSTYYGLQKTDEISLKGRLHSYSWDSGTSSYIESVGDWKDYYLNDNSYISYADSNHWYTSCQFYIKQGNDSWSWYTPNEAWMIWGNESDEDWHFSLSNPNHELIEVYDWNYRYKGKFTDNGDGTWNSNNPDFYNSQKLIGEKYDDHTAKNYCVDHYDSATETIYYTEGTTNYTTVIGEQGWIWQWNTEDKTLTHVTS